VKRRRRGDRAGAGLRLLHFYFHRFSRHIRLLYRNQYSAARDGGALHGRYLDEAEMKGLDGHDIGLSETAEAAGVRRKRREDEVTSLLGTSVLDRPESLEPRADRSMPRFYP
jgi:hypothetical protein